MTRYEYLKRCEQLCMDASNRTDDKFMQGLWKQKATELRIKADKLSLEKANEPV